MITNKEIDNKLFAMVPKAGPSELSAFRLGYMQATLDCSEQTAEELKEQIKQVKG